VKKTVDARGLSFPETWLLTSEALLDRHCLEVLAIVDNSNAIQEITNLIADLPYKATVEEKQGQYHINIQKHESVQGLRLASAEYGQTVLVISSTSLGKGEDHWGGQLMNSFIYSLMQLEGLLKTVVFINSGVFLATEGSDVLPYLQHMQESGVEIISSHTCLSYYQLLGKLRVGTMSNMFTITEKIAEAKRLIAF
jgi:selenium metabolism protein YedF